MAMKAFAPFLIVGSLSVIQSITIDQPWQNLLQNSMFQVHTIAPLSFFNSTMNSTNNHFAETINSYVTGQWLTDLKVDLSKHSDKKQKYPNGWSREEMEAGITWDQTHQNAIENAAYSTFAGFTSSSCASLPSSYSPFMFCSGVVDYPFFLMFNESMSHLETEARAQAAGLLAFLNTSCLSDAKKMICARVYRPCKAGKNLFETIYEILLSAEIPLMSCCSQGRPVHLAVTSHTHGPASECPRPTPPHPAPPGPLDNLWVLLRLAFAHIINQNLRRDPWSNYCPFSISSAAGHCAQRRATWARHVEADWRPSRPPT